MMSTYTYPRYAYRPSAAQRGAASNATRWWSSAPAPSA
jgi:hypothetical protein